MVPTTAKMPPSKGKGKGGGKGAAAGAATLSIRQGFPNGLRVLVVDEEQASLDGAVAVLEACNYSVTAAPSLSWGIEALKKASPAVEVVLVDLKALEREHTMVKKLRDAVKGAPLILMLEGGQAREVVRGINMGAIQILEKPMVEENARNIWQHVIRKMMADRGLRPGPPTKAGGLGVKATKGARKAPAKKKAAPKSKASQSQPGLAGFGQIATGAYALPEGNLELTLDEVKELLPGLGDLGPLNGGGLGMPAWKGDHFGGGDRYAGYRYPPQNPIADILATPAGNQKPPLGLSLKKTPSLLNLVSLYNSRD